MDEYRSYTDKRISEAKCLFQGFDFTNSDAEIEIDLRSGNSTATGTSEEILVEMSQQDSKLYQWNFVKHRKRSNRRYTVSHGSCTNLPPAPPSTPTSLTAANTPMSSPTASTNISNLGIGLNSADDEPLHSFLYILDYAPKYKKKLKEQQRTDAELAELFNVVTITGKSAGACGGGGGNNYGDCKSNKLIPERGIRGLSRVIRKHDASTKIFKIHRNPKEFFRDRHCDEENSVSAPEYDTEEEDTRLRRFTRIKPSRRYFQTKRQRRFARFEHKERMESIVDTFDAAMSFNDS